MKINDILYEALPPDDNPFGKDKRSQREKDKAAYMDSLTKVATWMGPNSKTWNDASNKLAIKMHKQGYNYKQIWGVTQNIMGTDGEWRQEIDDSGSRIIPNAKGNTMKDHIDHPELYAAYPGIEDTPFDANWDNRGDPAGGKVQNGKISIGAYYAGGELIDLQDRLGTANHEWSHVVQQDFEPKFSTGDNSRSDLSTTVAANNPGMTSTKAYLGKGGEHMAAASEYRHEYTDAMRKMNPPDLTKGADGSVADRVTIDKTDKVPNFNTRYPSDRNPVKGTTGTFFKTKHVTFDNPYVTDFFPDPSQAELEKIRRDLNVVKVDPKIVNPKPTKKVDPKVMNDNPPYKGPTKPIKRPEPPKIVKPPKKYGKKGKNGLGTMTATGQVLDWSPKKSNPTTGADGK